MKDVYDWTVIGAGPAGIAAVGKLLDNGVVPETIAWVDPYFNVGDLGSKWYAVPGNTKVALFLRYLQACRAFRYDAGSDRFSICKFNPSETCLLEHIVEPLRWVTAHLMEQVNARQDFAQSIRFYQGKWDISFSKASFSSQNIVLATGANPEVLEYPNTVPVKLQHALNPQMLSHYVQASDTVAVFGSSHSAMLAMMNLANLPVKKIINFYRSPLRYALDMGDWILFDDTGLKGNTAEWVKKYIDSDALENVSRVYAQKEAIQDILPTCDKVVYAVGFTRRQQPWIDVCDNTLSYIPQCGILAPGLFGLGIAYPEAKINPIGILEYRVGLWKFMEYLERVLPIWMRYVSVAGTP